jgi:dTDP-4-dehydrorhamnose 3,5-epimerase
MSALTVVPLALPGILEITPPRFTDERGFFSETYNRQAFATDGIADEFVQDNHAYSRLKGTFRGLHYQLPPRAQGKLLRALRGSFLDVMVDIRRSSPSFSKWLAVEVSASRWNQVYVPAGYAHGYLTLEDDTEVAYKVTDIYSQPHERAIRFDDPAIGITWPMPVETMRLSARDLAAPVLAAAEIFD